MSSIDTATVVAGIEARVPFCLVQVGDKLGHVLVVDDLLSRSWKCERHATTVTLGAHTILAVFPNLRFGFDELGLGTILGWVIETKFTAPDVGQHFGDAFVLDGFGVDVHPNLEVLWSMVYENGRRNHPIALFESNTGNVTPTSGAKAHTSPRLGDDVVCHVCLRR